MNSKLWIRKALSACLSLSLIATCSMVALANSAKVSGELSVAGQGGTVLVNGESAQSGRSIFSSNTVSTPEGAAAVIGFGKLGKIEIAPNSKVSLNFDDKGINADLAAGKLTVLGSASAVNVTTASGKVVNLTTGQSVLSSGLAQDDDDDDDDGGAAWWAFGAVMIAAGALIIYSVTKGDELTFGGNGTVVSPTR